MAIGLVFPAFQIRWVRTMEWTQSDTLGNQRRVERVPVNEFDGDKGSASAPMVRRGTVIGIATPKTGGEKHPDAVSKTQSHSDTGVIGILAEAVADSDRRKPRPGRPTMPFVMPITFEGIEIVTSKNQLQEDVWAGDAVLYDSANERLTVVKSDSTYFVGVASVFAPRGSDQVQVRVDAFARCHTFDPSDVSGLLKIDLLKYKALVAEIKDKKKKLTIAAAVQKATFTAFKDADPNDADYQSKSEANVKAVKRLEEIGEELLKLATQAEKLFSNSNLPPGQEDSEATIVSAMASINTNKVKTADDS
ncbi:MAG: hypothetical protein ACPGR8_01245 [Limisphaerales bacterium]